METALAATRNFHVDWRVAAKHTVYAPDGSANAFHHLYTPAGGVGGAPPAPPSAAFRGCWRHG